MYECLHGGCMFVVLNLGLRAKAWAWGLGLAAMRGGRLSGTRDFTPIILRDSANTNQQLIAFQVLPVLSRFAETK